MIRHSIGSGMEYQTFSEKTHLFTICLFTCILFKYLYCSFDDNADPTSSLTDETLACHNFSVNLKASLWLLWKQLTFLDQYSHKYHDLTQHKKSVSYQEKEKRGFSIAHILISPSHDSSFMCCNEKECMLKLNLGPSVLLPLNIPTCVTNSVHLTNNFHPILV